MAAAICLRSRTASGSAHDYVQKTLIPYLLRAGVCVPDAQGWTCPGAASRRRRPATKGMGPNLLGGLAQARALCKYPVGEVFAGRPRPGEGTMQIPGQGWICWAASPRRGHSPLRLNTFPVARPLAVRKGGPCAQVPKVQVTAAVPQPVNGRLGRRTSILAGQLASLRRFGVGQTARGKTSF